MALATGAGSDPSSTKPVFGPLVVFGLGHAGAPPADTAALADLLLRVSRMADDLPELAELELTVLAGPGGARATAARVRVVPAEHTDPFLRRLR